MVPGAALTYSFGAALGFGCPVSLLLGLRLLLGGGVVIRPLVGPLVSPGRPHSARGVRHGCVEELPPGFRVLPRPLEGSFHIQVRHVDKLVGLLAEVEAVGLAEGP